MSLSDCEKCWSTPCECGHDYKNWDLARLKRFSEVIGNIIDFYNKTLGMSPIEVATIMTGMGRAKGITNQDLKEKTK